MGEYYGEFSTYHKTLKEKKACDKSINNAIIDFAKVIKGIAKQFPKAGITDTAVAEAIASTICYEIH